MDKFMMMPKGFMGLPMDDEFITNAENKKNYAVAVSDWNYGDAVRREGCTAQALLKLWLLRQQLYDPSQD